MNNFNQTQIAGIERDWWIEDGNIFLITGPDTCKLAGSLEDIKSGRHNLNGWGCYEPYNDVAHILWPEEVAAAQDAARAEDEAEATRAALKNQREQVKAAAIELADSFQGDLREAIERIADLVYPHAPERAQERWDELDGSDLRRRLVEESANYYRERDNEPMYLACQTLAWCANGALSNACITAALLLGLDAVKNALNA